jgi:dihydrofolate reductase
MQARLVDEYQIWVHPVALGRGKPLFKNARQQLYLQLKQTKPFSSGVVLCYYQAGKCRCNDVLNNTDIGTIG